MIEFAMITSSSKIEENPDHFEEACEATKKGPVYIGCGEGEKSLVLISIEEFERLMRR